MALTQQPSSGEPPLDWLSHFTCMGVPFEQFEAWAIQDLIVEKMLKKYPGVIWCGYIEDGTFQIEVDDLFDPSMEQQFDPIDITYSMTIPDKSRYELCAAKSGSELKNPSGYVGTLGFIGHLEKILFPTVSEHVAVTACHVCFKSKDFPTKWEEIPRELTYTGKTSTTHFLLDTDLSSFEQGMSFG